jgi:hypothetical protein
MKEIPGTKLRAMKVKQGHPVDCREWLEFAILEIKYDGIRVRYRKLDAMAAKAVESIADGEPSMVENNL